MGATRTTPQAYSQSIDSSAGEAEQALIHRLQAGDHEAFEEIFRRYASRVYRQAIALLGREIEADEVVQEVFLAVYAKAKTFRGQAAFSTWLYRLTANAAITRLRKRKRGREVAFDDYLPQFREDGHHRVSPVVDWSEALEASLDSRETRRVLQQCLDELPPMDKAVVILSDVDELSNREIGRVLGLSVPAVKARLHRARLFLRGRLAVHLGHSPS